MGTLNKTSDRDPNGGCRLRTALAWFQNSIALHTKNGWGAKKIEKGEVLRTIIQMGMN